MIRCYDVLAVCTNMTSPVLEKLSSNKVFEGDLVKYKFKVPSEPIRLCFHSFNDTQSAALGGLYANFNLFLPLNPGPAKVPILTWLAGLTCTEDNG
jgi:hypothetical protein